MAQYLLPKLVGCYEAELHDIISAVVKMSVSRLVDIGAAEGFYAVGMARVLPNCHVIAFETNFLARRSIRRLARVNDVSNRLSILGKCDRNKLGSIDLRASVIVCDCEGAEEELLAPALVPGLAECNLLLVELHEMNAPGVTDLLRRRFERTHELTFAKTKARKSEEWLDAQWSGEEANIMLNEWRGGCQQWLIARRKGVS